MSKGIFFLVLSVLILGACKKEFKYTNPIKNGLQTGIRDAQVFQDDDGTYYLMGTAHPFWPREGKSPGIKIYSSNDLLNWTFEKMLIDRNNLDTCVWYLDRFWAPELHKLRGKYYLTFNCQNETSVSCPHGQALGLAEADNVMGPYTVLTQEKPLHGGNDLTLFEDVDGKIYAFWNGAKRMYAAELDIENAELIPSTIEVIFRPTENTWDAIGIEGPYCIEQDGTYFLFYSSWSRGYEIGYATAKHPLGPWKKYEGNPIYGAQNKAACEKNNLPYTQSEDMPFKAVGHNEIWKGPDGRFWISCHGILKGDGEQPALVIDPIDIVDGIIYAKGPTYTEQIIKY